MKVSVAMTTYNGQKFLDIQLKSILCQTIKPDELIICDDHSTDNTLEILRDFKEQVDFDVKIFENKKNIGFVKNFEKAISLCTKDIIFISDQDDYWFPNKIEFMKNLLISKKNCFVAINNAELTDINLNPTNILKLNQVKDFSGDDIGYIPGCCTVFKKEILEIILPISKSMAYDSWIHFIGMNTNSRIVSKKILQFYRRHDDNASNHPVSRLVKVNKKERYFKALKRFFSFNPSSERHIYNKTNLNESLILKKRLQKTFFSEEANDVSFDKAKMKKYLEKKIYIYKLTYELQNKTMFVKFFSSLLNLLCNKIKFKDFVFINF
tara:strand:- start:480 stop:1448 length:969 start_codon:yes stop_codon:yes gene_type:complete